MTAKGCAADLATAVIDQLKREGLQSDSRFAEAFVRMRRQRGYGPFRIRRELTERGINDELSAAILDERSAMWMEELERVRHKKFGHRPPKTFTERAKQARFLQYRGFTLDQIQAMFNTRDLE